MFYDLAVTVRLWVIASSTGWIRPVITRCTCMSSRSLRLSPHPGVARTKYGMRCRNVVMAYWFDAKCMLNTIDYCLIRLNKYNTGLLFMCICSWLCIIKIIIMSGIMCVQYLILYHSMLHYIIHGKLIPCEGLGFRIPSRCYPKQVDQWIG